MRELAACTEGFVFDDGREVALKGLDGIRRVYGVDWAAGMAGHGTPRPRTTASPLRVA